MRRSREVSGSNKNSNRHEPNGNAVCVLFETDRSFGKSVGTV